MVKKVLLGVAAGFATLVLLLVIVILMQPAEFRVARSATIAAPPERVFEQLNDFHNWEDWSPWAKLDPEVKNSFEGPSSGKGAAFRWSGNNQVGEGRMEILESRPGELVRIQLEFFRPFEDRAEAVFALQPEGEQTHITWSMEGKNNFFSKAISLVMDMDALVGGSFEQGLASIKSKIEGRKR